MVPPALPLWAWLLVCLGALLVLLPRGVPLRALGAVMLLALWVPRSRCRSGKSRSGSWTLARGWRCCCVPSITTCCMTPGRPGAKVTWGAGGTADFA